MQRGDAASPRLDVGDIVVTRFEKNAGLKAFRICAA